MTCYDVRDYRTWATMRRLFSFLLVYAVLLTQGIAPVSSSLAAARSLDPLSHAIICSELADTSEGSKDHHGSADDYCPQCSLAIASFAISTSQARILLAPQIAHNITWQFTPDALNGISVQGSHQARAPPITL